jgi:hypothetical protein
MYTKYTEGYVRQDFDERGECTGQAFHAGEPVTYHRSDIPIDMEEMPLKGEEYFPFDMIQPNVLQVVEMPVSEISLNEIFFFGNNIYRKTPSYGDKVNAVIIGQFGLNGKSHYFPGPGAILDASTLVQTIR